MQLKTGSSSTRAGARPAQAADRFRNIQVGLFVAGAVLLPFGLLVIGLGWYGSAHTPYLYNQMSYLVSGGLMGLGLTFAGGFLYFGAWLAKSAADQRETNRELTEALLAVADLVGRGGQGLAGVSGAVSTDHGLPPVAPAPVVAAPAVAPVLEFRAAESDFTAELPLVDHESSEAAVTEAVPQHAAESTEENSEFEVADETVADGTVADGTVADEAAADGTELVSDDASDTADAAVGAGSEGQHESEHDGEYDAAHDGAHDGAHYGHEHTAVMDAVDHEASDETESPDLSDAALEAFVSAPVYAASVPAPESDPNLAAAPAHAAPVAAPIAAQTDPGAMPVTVGTGTTVHRRDCQLIAHRTDLVALSGNENNPPTCRVCKPEL